MTAQERLDRADVLAQAATDGPWAARRLPKSAPIGQYVMDARGTSVCHIGAIYHDSHDGDVVADAEFIAAARSLVPAMSAALRGVLDLHHRVPVYPLVDDCGHHGVADHEVEEDREGYIVCLSAEPIDHCCAACTDLDGYAGVHYPCPTVRAITDALDGAS